MNKKITYHATLRFRATKQGPYKQSEACSEHTESEQLLEETTNTLEELIQTIEKDTDVKRSDWTQGKTAGVFACNVNVVAPNRREATGEEVADWRAGHQILWNRECIITITLVETSPITGFLIPGTKSLGLLPFDEEDQEGFMPLEEFIQSCKYGTFVDDDGSGVYATTEGKTNLDAAPSDIVDGCINYDYTHVVWYNK